MVLNNAVVSTNQNEAQCNSTATDVATKEKKSSKVDLAEIRFESAVN